MEKSSLVKNIQRAALIIGVLIIPLMYSYFYLNAFWDPYQRLDKVPVAVVNLDEGAVINGEERNLGDEIVDKLKDEKELDFNFTGAKRAKAGVLGNDYYASITIPKSFSSDAATVGEDTEKLHGKIIYSANQKRNYLAAQILENAMPKIKESVNSKIDKQIVGTISDKVKEVPEQLGTLDEGLSKLDNGAGQLKDGTAKLSNGANVLSQGISKLNGNVPALKKGASKLNGGAAKLSKGMKTITGNSKALNNGASQVAGGAGSLKNGLASYTNGVSQAKDGASELTNGIKQFTGGVEQLAAGAEKLDSGLNKVKGGVDQMDQKVSEAKSKLDKQASEEALDQLDQGAATLSGGLSQLNASFDVSDLKNAVDAYNAKQISGDKFANMLIQSGVVNKLNEAKTSIEQLSAGASSLNSGVNSLTGGMRTVKGNIGELQGGLGQLKTGLGDSKTPGETVMYGSAQIKNGLSQLQGNSSALNEGASKLDTGLGTLSSNNDKLNSGASQLAEGSKSLESGVNKYTKGVGSAQKGAGQLADGTSQLQGKLPVLASGVNQLDNGGKQLADGAGTLNEGTGKLKDGIGTAGDGVSTAIGKANTEVKKLDGLAEYAKEPVKTKTEYVQPVANYGSAFAPYFMGLSLWVGGLLIFFGLYFDYSRRIKMLSQESTRVIARALAFGAVSVGQGVLLAFVIKSVLHIAVRNPFALYWSSILVAMTFTAIIMFCIINLKDIGKFIVMLLLILQLTSCAGTFPIETQNAFFRAINPFLPMTYSTQLFKEAISGTMGTNAANSALILLSFFAGFMALTMMLSHKKIKKDIKHIAQEAKVHAA